MIFWRDVIGHIDDFQLLTDDMTDYFTQYNLYADTDDPAFDNQDIFNSIAHNDPKSGGKDFKVCVSPEQDNGLDVNDEPVTLLKVSETFKSSKTYRGTFSIDTDSDSDDNCIKVAPDQQPKAMMVDGFLEGLLKAFSGVLKPNESEGMSLDQIALNLANPDVFINDGDLKNLPIGMQQFMDQMFQRGKENYDASSSLDVPSSLSLVQRSSLSSGTSNQPAFGKVLRSNSSSSSPLQAASPMRKPRSKKALVPSPASNARMEQFATKFSSTKRRRSSSSPDTKSKP